MKSSGTLCKPFVSWNPRRLCEPFIGWNPKKCCEPYMKRRDVKMDERTIKCPMCEAVIEDVCILPPGVIARFYKWTGTINNINGISHESYYCSRHSTEEITVFEDKHGVK